MKLLLVDDNQILLEQMKKYLGKRDHEVETVERGEAAVEALEKTGYDVCITDLKMPGMNGEELLKRIVKDHPATKVVIMTAYGSVRKALEALKLGAFDFVHKPFQMAQIMDILARIENPDKAKETEG